MTNGNSIKLNQPLTIPAASYNAAGVESINFMQPALAGSAGMTYHVRPCIDDANGNMTSVAPPSATIVDTIPDVYTLAAQRAAAGKPNLANGIAAIVAALKEIEIEKGRLPVGA